MQKFNPFDETLADLADLKVECTADGAVTLTGIDYQTFRSILTSASLYRYDHPFKPEVLDPDCTYNELIRGNAKESQRWHWLMNDTLDQLEYLTALAISPDYPPMPSLPLLRKCRRLQPDDAWLEPEPAPVTAWGRLSKWWLG